MPLRNPWPEYDVEVDSDDGVPEASFSSVTLQALMMQERKNKEIKRLRRQNDGTIIDDILEASVKVRPEESKRSALHGVPQAKCAERGSDLFIALFARCSLLAQRVAKFHVVRDFMLENDNVMMLLKFQLAKKLHVDSRMIVDKECVEHRYNWLDVVVCLCKATAHIYQRYGFSYVTAGSIFDLVVVNIVRRPYGCLLAMALRDSPNVTQRHLWLTACAFSPFLPLGYDVLIQDVRGNLSRQKYRLNGNLRDAVNLFPMINCDAKGNFCVYSGYI